MVSQQEREQAVPTAESVSATEEQVSLTADDTSDLLHGEEEMDIDMDTLIDESMSSIEQGQVITGRVVKVTQDGVVVDIGSKSEGVIPLSEFDGDGDEGGIKAGMDIEVMVVRNEGRDGLPILSRRRAKERTAKKLVRKAYEKGEAVRCTVKTILRGGFEVDVDGLRGFIPFSQMGPGARTPEDQQSLLGQRIEAKILEMRNKRDLILSQRKAIEEKRERLRQETLGNLKEGSWVKGVVKNLTDFGAFVDLGGIDGLLHVKDMSWDHVAHPRDMVKVGDEIEVMVLGLEGERISLGLKQKSLDPWETVPQKYPIGAVLAGKVSSLTKYGAFIHLEEGVEGLIHVSEMSWTKRVRHPNEILKDGEEVRVKVLSIDFERKRISLSLRQTAVDPWTLAKANYPTGSVIEGEVTGMTDFGAFVRLPEGVDGMIHVSDLSWADKAVHPKKILKKGERVRVKVLEIDPSQQRISLGLKQLEPDPWETAAKKYRTGTVVEVVVRRVTEFGAFVELEDGIEGLAHSSALVPKGQNHEHVVKVGETLTMKVTKFDLHNHKISLSLREYQREQEDKEVKQFMQTESGGNATLGELLGAQMKVLMEQQQAKINEQKEDQVKRQAEEIDRRLEEQERLTVVEPVTDEVSQAPVLEETQPADHAPEAQVPIDNQPEEEPADLVPETQVSAEEQPEEVPADLAPETQLSVEEQPAEVSEDQSLETPAPMEDQPTELSPEEQAISIVDDPQETPSEVISSEDLDTISTGEHTLDQDDRVSRDATDNQV